MAHGLFNILSFLKDNNIFYLIGTIGTILMWQEARQSRLRLDEPHLQISLEPDEKRPKFFKLIIENLGPVPIYNLKIKIHQKGLKTMDNRNVEDLKIFKNRIPVLGIQRRLRSVLISAADAPKERSKHLGFAVEYQQKDGKVKKQKFDFDLEIYEDLHVYNENSR